MADDIKKTRRLLDQAQTVIETQKSQVTDLTAQVTRLLKVKEAAEKAVRSLKDLKVEYETLTKKYYASTDKVTELEGVITGLKGGLNKKQEENDALQNQILGLIKDVTGLRQQLRAQGTAVLASPEMSRVPTDKVVADPSEAEGNVAVLKVRNKSCCGCLAHKTRCNGLEPCQQCIKKGEVCEYRFRYKGYQPDLPKGKKRQLNSSGEDGGGKRKAKATGSDGGNKEREDYVEEEELEGREEEEWGDEKDGEVDLEDAGLRNGEETESDDGA